MNTTHNSRRMVGALLSGGVALAGFGLTAGTARPPRNGQARRSTTRITPARCRVQSVRAHPCGRRFCDGHQPWSQFGNGLLLPPSATGPPGSSVV